MLILFACSLGAPNQPKLAKNTILQDCLQGWKQDDKDDNFGVGNPNGDARIYWHPHRNFQNWPALKSARPICRYPWLLYYTPSPGLLRAAHPQREFWEAADGTPSLSIPRPGGVLRTRQCWHNGQNVVMFFSGSPKVACFDVCIVGVVFVAGM